MFASASASTSTSTSAKTTKNRIRSSRRRRRGRRGSVLANSDTNSSRRNDNDDDDDDRNRASENNFVNRRNAILNTLKASLFASSSVLGLAAYAKDNNDAGSSNKSFTTAREIQDQYWRKLKQRDSAYYTYWWALPLAPYKTKTTFITNPTFNEERAIVDSEGNRTIVKENLLQEKIWTFDQLQGLLDVYVNVRMTVVKLKEGGLWVHNPVAATSEVIDALRKLERKHGKVKYIVVGSAAIEHKIYSGPFAQYFPDADVWLPKDDWTFPINVKLGVFVPIFPKKPKYLPLSSSETFADDLDGNVPWKDEIEHETLKVGGSSLRNFKDPWFVDTAFYVKDTKTLIVTDVVEKVSNTPVPVATIDPEPLYIRAMDKKGELKPFTAETRSEGWGKTVLFGLLFNPDSVDVTISLPTAANDLLDSFTWDKSWKPAFENLVTRKMFVPPVLAILAFPRRKKEVKEFCDAVCGSKNNWKFTNIIPAHLDGPFECSPSDFRACIEYSLNTSAYDNFGKDAFTLMEVSRLSEEIGSLERP
jgi:hypothetical protein